MSKTKVPTQVSHRSSSSGRFVPEYDRARSDKAPRAQVRTRAGVSPPSTFAR
jgi:hypothetical protein